MAMSKEDILNAVAELSVLELVELIEAFEEKFNVSAAAVAVAAGIKYGITCRLTGMAEHPKTYGECVVCDE